MSGKKIFKYVVVLAVTIIFLCIFFIFGKAVKKKWIVYKTLHAVHWLERNAQTEQIKPGKYKIIFLGNSLTELFNLSYYYKDSTILNCGIVGDFTIGLVKRAGTITRLKPQKIFIEIGINDMIEQISLDEICFNYEQLIKIIQKESPGTKIFIQSNLPVIINRPSLFTGDKYVNELIKRQNDNLRALAKNTNCVYIDVYSAFAKEKERESLFIWDGIHFTPKGYEIWSGVVLPYLVSSERDK